MSSAVPVRLLKRDLLFILEKADVSVMDESRIETLARQHGIRRKRDDGGVWRRPSRAFIRRADEGVCFPDFWWSRASCLPLHAATRQPVLKDAATAYKVDTDAITVKVKQEFTAKEKTKNTRAHPATKIAKKAA